jgi:hypothetical protein
MKVSELMGSRVKAQPRGVGAVLPDRRLLMGAAMDLYRQLGLDVEVDGNRIFVSCGQAISGRVLELVELRTGMAGFNDWSA